MSLSELQETVMTGKPGVLQLVEYQRVRLDLATEQQQQLGGKVQAWGGGQGGVSGQGPSERGREAGKSGRVRAQGAAFLWALGEEGRR